MLTPATLHIIESLFRDALVREGAPHGMAQCQTGLTLEPARKPGERHAVMINISSYTFRIVAIFEFPVSEEQSTLWAQQCNISPGPQQASRLRDAFAERVNMICGSAKRTLGFSFAHVGMSTPISIDANCAQHLSTICGEAIQQFAVTLDDGLAFGCTLCIHSAGKKALDIRHIPAVSQSTDEQSCGELELF